QVRAPGDVRQDGCWHDTKFLGGPPGDLYATAVCCFALAIPNRYLPILQEGKIKQYQMKTKE
ncbi:MAG TPA: squalene--hopene cyclase, partial [Pirellulales bacterium]|nr:squalene--hopene cyclase [Pirellulales bacterium]